MGNKVIFGVYYLYLIYSSSIAFNAFSVKGFTTIKPSTRTTSGILTTKSTTKRITSCRQKAFFTKMSSSLARRRQNLKDGSGSIEIEKMESLFWPNPSRKILQKPTKIDKAYKNKQQEHAIDYYDKIFDCIVKIYATHNKEPDPTMPWQKNHSYTSTSTGFVISTQTGDGKQKQKILTNAHSVQYAGQILVRKRGSSKKFRASIQIIANECDLALLTINDDSFWYSYKEEGEDDDNDYEYGGDYDHNDEIDGEKDQDELGDEDKDEDEYTNSKGVITTKPLEFGVLPELQDEVEVIGKCLFIFG